MEQILARARKRAEAAEVFIARIEETPVQFETNRLKHIHSKQTCVVALRVIKNGRIGFATSSGLEDIDTLVGDAIATAEFGQEARFKFPAYRRFPDVEIFDPSVDKVTLRQMAALGEEMIAAITASTPGILCEASVNKVSCESTIMNSRGGRTSFRQTVFGVGVEGQLIRGTDMLFVGDHESSCHPILDVTKINRTVTRQLELARKQASVTSKPMTVIFTPDGVGSALVLPLMSAFNGKTVLEGASPIGNKLGQPAFDRRLTVLDDPTIPFRPGSRPCDDEGVPCRKRSLVQAGVVKNFLYDLQTAAKAGTKSTGNGRRGMGSLPSPSVHILVLEGGDTSFDEMVKGAKEGLVVEQLMGASQGNILGGDFSGNVLLGFKIESGEIVGRVKDTMVSGNIYKLLNNIAAIGNDSKWVGGALNVPSLCFENVSVASG